MTSLFAKEQELVSSKPVVDGMGRESFSASGDNKTLICSHEKDCPHNAASQVLLGVLEQIQRPFRDGFLFVHKYNARNFGAG